MTDHDASAIAEEWIRRIAWIGKDDDPCAVASKAAGIMRGLLDAEAAALHDAHQAGKMKAAAQRDELLTALVDIVEDLKARWDMNDSRTNPGIRENVRQAEAVIARARAEEHNTAT